MKTLKDLLEQWVPLPSAKPVDVPDEVRRQWNLPSLVGTDDNQDSNDTQDTNDIMGLGGIINSSSSNSKVGDLILSSNTESINIAKEEAKRDADDYTEGHISIESATTSPTNKDRVVLVGKTLEKDDHFFPVEKGPTGKYGWINNDPDSGDNKWRDFTDY